MMNRVEHLGNKTILDKVRNIRASNGYFVSKRKIYADCPYGMTRHIAETHADWAAEDIEIRDKELTDLRISTFKEWGLDELPKA